MVSNTYFGIHSPFANKPTTVVVSFEPGTILLGVYMLSQWSTISKFSPAGYPIYTSCDADNANAMCAVLIPSTNIHSTGGMFNASVSEAASGGFASSDPYQIWCKWICKVHLRRVQSLIHSFMRELSCTTSCENHDAAMSRRGLGFHTAACICRCNRYEPGVNASSFCYPTYVCNKEGGGE